MTSPESKQVVFMVMGFFYMLCLLVACIALIYYSGH